MIYSIAYALLDGVESSPSPVKPPQRLRRRRGAKPLQFTLDGRSLRFDSVDDFSFAIECRTCVPSSRFHAMFEYSAEELWEEAQSIKTVEKNLADILEDALCDGTPCGAAIARLGLKVFTNDHDWRSMIEALIELNDSYDGYKRLALIKYMQYLGARQEILRLIFAIKNRGARNLQRSAGDSTSGDRVLETVVFDVNEITDPDDASDPLQRLPQGEAVKLYALPGHAVNIRLAKYPFSLLNDNGWMLREPSGRTHRLNTQQIMVGRGRENDIRLDSEFRNISRRHLLLEPLDDHVILLTDLSSHGTFTPAIQTEHIPA